MKADQLPAMNARREYRSSSRPSNTSPAQPTASTSRAPVATSAAPLRIPTPATPRSSAPRQMPMEPVAPLKLAVEVVKVDPKLTTKQAAVFLGRTADALKKWRQREGMGPTFIRHPDGGIFYKLSELKKFEEKYSVRRK